MWIRRIPRSALLIALLFSGRAVQGHEGHAALPSKGATIDRDQLLLSAPAREALGVRTGKVSLGKMRQTLRVNAHVLLPAHQHALVTTLVPGKVDEVLVRPGEQVSAGQELCRIESLEFETLQLDYLQGATALDLARNVLVERQTASQKGAIPERLLLEARTEVEQQTARFAIAARKLQALGIDSKVLEELRRSGEPLRFVTVRSPRDGVVMEADVRFGQAVKTTDHLFHIVDRTRLEVIGDVLETDAALVSVGAPVRMGFASPADEIFTGTIQSLEAKVDPQRHVAGAIVAVANPNLSLRPGMFGWMEIDLSGSDDVILCPRDALIESRGATYALLLRGEGKYLRKAVNVGHRSGKDVEITKGLFPGDQVVVVGTQTLSSLFGQSGAATGTDRQPAKAGEQAKPGAPSKAAETVLVTQATVEIPTGRKTFAMPLLEGKLDRLHVRPNQPVRAGELLAELDSQEFRTLQLEFLQARARRDWLESLIPRLQKLADEGLVPRVRFMELKAESKSMRDKSASLERKFTVLGFSQEELDSLRNDTLSDQLVEHPSTLRLPIRAPADGALTRFDVVPGQVVSAETPLFEVHDLSAVWVRGFVFERDASRIEVGQPASVTFPARPGLELKGKLVRISPALHEKSRVLPVWIEVTHPDHALKEGMLARAVIQSPRSGETSAKSK